MNKEIVEILNHVDKDIFFPIVSTARPGNCIHNSFRITARSGRKRWRNLISSSVVSLGRVAEEGRSEGTHGFFLEHGQLPIRPGVQLAPPVATRQQGRDEPAAHKLHPATTGAIQQARAPPSNNDDASALHLLWQYRLPTPTENYAKKSHNRNQLWFFWPGSYAVSKRLQDFFFWFNGLKFRTLGACNMPLERS